MASEESLGQIKQLQAILDDEEVIIEIKTKGEKYDEFRPLLLTAQKSMNNWLEEPEEEVRDDLFSESCVAWQALFEWLMASIADGDWNPEWLGWMCYSLLFEKSPWEAISEAVKIISCWVKRHSEPNHVHERAFENCLKIMDAVLCDGQGEPMILVPMRVTGIVGTHNITDLTHGLNTEQMDEVKSELSSETLNELKVERDWVKAIKQNAAELSSHASARNMNLVTRQLQVTMDRISELMTFFIGDDGGAPQPAVEAVAEVAFTGEQATSSDEAANNNNGVSPVAAGAVNTTVPGIPPLSDIMGAPENRDQARALLQMLVEYFRATEPLSPVSFLLEKALRWTGYTLPQLLASELHKDNDTRARLCNQLGLPELAEKS